MLGGQTEEGRMEMRKGDKEKAGIEKKVSTQLRNESQLGRLDIAARQRQRLRVVKVQQEH